MGNARRFQSYEEFWPFYVQQHSNSSCRALHFAGTTVALASVAAGIVVSLRWLIGAPVAGYSFAWIGHFLFENNQPAAFHNPLWSLRADFRMYRCTLMGRMGGEVLRTASAVRR